MKKYGIILFGLGMLLAQPVAAQIAPALPDQGTVQYAYNNPGVVKASWNGIYVGPYSGTLFLPVGSDPTTAAISLYCVDFLHYALPGKVITASVSNIGGGNTSLARLGAGGLVAYKKAAFLSSLFQSYATIAQFSGLTQAQAWSGIHAAIWSFTSGGGPYGGDPFFGVFAAYANNHFDGYGDYDQWSVLTTKSVANNYRPDSQEFLVQTQGLPRLTAVPEVPPTVTPEPQTYVLMLSGLIFLVLIGRRRLKEIGYA